MRAKGNSDSSVRLYLPTLTNINCQLPLSLSKQAKNTKNKFPTEKLLLSSQILKLRETNQFHYHVNPHCTIRLAD